MQYLISASLDECYILAVRNTIVFSGKEWRGSMLGENRYNLRPRFCARLTCAKFAQGFY